MARRTIRITAEMDKKLQSAAKVRGYSTPSALMRAAIEKELQGRSNADAEEKIAASFDQVRREILRLMRTQQALFAFVDSLAKVLLTCLPEPDGESMEAAVAKARARHARLLKAAGQAMLGDSQLAIEDLIGRV
jgi:Arc/MetJ-type ribon-helix-helix transcriptional regulator